MGKVNLILQQEQQQPQKHHKHPNHLSAFASTSESILPPSFATPVHICKHVDRVPVIVEKHARSKLIPDISKRKFLAPGDIAVTQLISEIRKHIELRPDEAIFLFVNGHSLPQSGALLSQVYEKHKDEDGFLYIVYSADSMMGASC